MKRYISFLALLFFSIGWAQAQPKCTSQDACFTFNFFGAEQLENGNYNLTFTIENSCPDPIEFVSFDFGFKPQMQAAAPQGYKYSTSPKSTQTDDSNTAIYFEADNSLTPMAATRVTRYIQELTPQELAAVECVKVRAIAGNTAGTAVFCVDECIGRVVPDPTCVLEHDERFLFGFIDAIQNSNNTTTVRFGIQNSTASNTREVTITVPEAPQPIQVATDANGNYSYIYNYSVSINQQLGRIKFNATDPNNGYAAGNIDLFAFTIPTELYNRNPVFLLGIQTFDNQADSLRMNTAECDEIIDPLPVELVSFEGKPTPGGIDLTWSTASETNNDRFEVERSRDGQSFTTIATVNGAGNSSTRLSYSYTDQTAERGLNYYRIKQVDFDGTSELSKVIAVTSNTASTTNSLAIHPNPASEDYVVVSLENNSAGNVAALLQIMDMNGRVVHYQEIQPGSRQIELSLPSLKMAKGMYYIKLNQGDIKETKKLIVQ